MAEQPLPTPTGFNLEPGGTSSSPTLEGSWWAVLNAGSYEFEIQEYGSGSWSTLVTNTTEGTSFSRSTGVDPGTQYRARVTALPVVSEPDPDPEPEPDPEPDPGSGTGGSGGALTDQLWVDFSAGGISSQYHCFANGLNWSQPVGICIYMDGSGGYGIDNPTGTYLLDSDGSNGLVAVAKSHNMLLLVPEAPPPGCPSDNCWYNESTSPNAAQKSDWLRSLVDFIYSRYNIDKTRVAVGGYSSGAQATTRWFIPRHGAEIMDGGVFVTIAYGGAPAGSAGTPNFPQWFKDSVVGYWNTGTADEAYTSASYGAIGGYNWYTSNGFTTDYDWPSGVGHGRSGEFDDIMDFAITSWIGAP